MNNFIIIKVDNFLDRFIRKCNEHDISLHHIEYIDDNSFLVKVNLVDYKRIKKLNYYSDIKIIKYQGVYGIKRLIKYNILTLVFILLSFALMDIITSYIVRIDIIHENEQIRELVKEELEKSDIKRFGLAKEFDELETVKNQILEDNPTKLEWLSITRVGMIYLVRIEERIITEIKPKTGFAHLISTKNALITKITSNKGEVMVRSGEYVSKGDVLISGEIKLYDAVKGNTLADGEIYGDVWYTSDISFPLSYQEQIYTDKERFNISINNKIVRRNKYEYFAQKKLKRFKILGVKIAFYTEAEYNLKNKKYTLKEAEKIAMEKIEREMLVKLNNKGKIISQKVLQKEQINSTMNMSVFIITNELISSTKHYTPIKEKEINDSENRD